MPKVHAGAGAVGMNPKKPEGFHGGQTGGGFVELARSFSPISLLSLSVVDCGCFSPKLAK